MVKLLVSYYNRKHSFLYLPQSGCFVGAVSAIWMTEIFTSYIIDIPEGSVTHQTFVYLIRLFFFNYYLQDTGYKSFSKNGNSEEP